MALLMKAGIVGGLATSVVLPVTITSSTGTNSVGLLDLDSLDKNKKQAPAKNAHEALSRAGYRKKIESELVDLSKDRSTKYGLNFALGCHRLIFGGSNVRRLLNHNTNADSGFRNEGPMEDYLGKDTSQPILGCSTASTMKWESENVYEFELAVKRGDIGFLERITVWKNTNNAVSQLTILKKARNYRGRYSWFNWYGIQRETTQDQGFEIGNPKDGTWKDLRTEDGSKSNPNYFTVWIEDNKEPSSNKSILKGLGIKTKPDKKLFSSIAKADNKDDWYFNFFETESDPNYPISINARPHSIRNYATYNSKIASEVENFKGSWKDVTEFCKSQEGRENEKLPYADTERLKSYCYTNKPKTARS